MSLQAEHRALQESTSAMVQREERAKSIIENLTALVKELQETLTKMTAKADADAQVIREKENLIEAHQQKAKKEEEKIALLTSELDKYSSKVVALESLTRGLKEERELWSKELASQG